MADSQEEVNNRNPDGTFKDGVSGNPGGRPKGSFSITTLIKQRLEEVPVGQMKTYGEQIVDTIMHNAIVNKDQKALKDIWNYIDGLPKGTLSIDADKESLATLTSYFRAMADSKDAKPNE